jgi:hypothetical protein
LALRGFGCAGLNLLADNAKRVASHALFVMAKASTFPEQKRIVSDDWTLL